MITNTEEAVMDHDTRPGKDVDEQAVTSPPLDDPQEVILLLHLIEVAHKNQKTPGQAWARLQRTRIVEGGNEQGFKVFHVDLETNRATITEEWAGVETARQTMALDALPSEPEGESPPTPPPDEGPKEPAFYWLPFRARRPSAGGDLRRWVQERAEEDVPNLSVLPRRIRLFRGGLQEVLDLPRPFAPGVAPGTGATLRSLSGRPGVDRRFVEGWFADDEGRGTAWVLDVGSDVAGCWFATRPFERRPGSVGMWTGDWSQRTGLGLDPVSLSLLAIVKPPLGEKAIAVGEPMQVNPPEIGMTGGTLPPTEPVPSTAEGVAERVGRDYESRFYGGTLDEGARLTVFRGREWEAWMLKGRFPMGLDDVVRAISARGDRPTSLALVQVGVVPLEGDAFRALVTQGEAQGRRFTRAMLIRTAPDGTITGHRIVVRDDGVIGEQGWMGVAPPEDMTLFTLGAGEA